jgi:hypothetical protein
MLAVACVFACGGRAKRATAGNHDSTAGDAGEGTTTGGSTAVGGGGGSAGSGAASSSGGAAGSGAMAGSAGAGCPPAFAALDPANARCGDETCEALPVANSRVGNYAMHCCTTEGRCGSGSQRVYGSGCFERDQPGSLSDACPSQSVLVTYDAISDVPVGDYFEGCCLPEGLCGLDTSASLGAGCVERSILKRAIHTTCTRENHELELESIPCTPSASAADRDE